MSDSPKNIPFTAEHGQHPTALTVATGRAGAVAHAWHRLGRFAAGPAGSAILTASIVAIGVIASAWPEPFKLAAARVSAVAHFLGLGNVPYSVSPEWSAAVLFMLGCV
jgi:hypothetical protein